MLTTLLLQLKGRPRFTHLNRVLGSMVQSLLGSIHSCLQLCIGREHSRPCQRADIASLLGVPLLQSRPSLFVIQSCSELQHHVGHVLHAGTSLHGLSAEVDPARCRPPARGAQAHVLTWEAGAAVPSMVTPLLSHMLHRLAVLVSR